MTLLSQLKARRLQLGLDQKDMKMRVGMSQQQYQRIEAGGNPRLNTLELIAEGLEAELLVVPKDKSRAVKALLIGGGASGSASQKQDETDENPWSDILE